MRLPNNAYDALRSHTQKLLDEGNSSAEVFQTQLSLMNNISIFHDEVSRLRSSTAPPELSEYARSRLLRLPAVGLKIPGLRKAPTAPAPSSSYDAPVPSSSSSQPASTTTSLTSPPPSLPQSQPPTAINTTNSNPATSSQPKVGSKSDPEKQKAQRAEYIKLQREREQKARDERERVKAQIKADREERRRLDDLRKGILPPGDSSTASSTSSYTRSQRPNTSEIRIQVRTFDGSTLRSTFAPSATLSTDVRPWIDSTTENTIPYNLKLILTPSPIRSIEASEEELTLSDLGIVGSCTLVMAPVKGYVESYTGSSAGGMLSSAVSGGYSLVSGTAGFVFGGVKNILGYGQPSDAPSSSSSSSVPGGGPGSESGSGPSDRDVAKVRVRTLADQRAEAAKRGNQFYNGNQLNFEPKKKDDDEDDGNGNGRRSKND